jgi:hypothetical protein
MVKVTVKLHESNQTRTHYGSERECEDFLRHLFPTETAHAHRLLACVEAINKEGFAQVEVEPFKDRNSNMLPEGYETPQPGEDTWRRSEE